MTTPPSWYHDGQLSLDRQRMAQAHAVVTRVTDEIPVGAPATDLLQAARADAWRAERLFAERFVELAGTEGCGVEEGWRAGDVVVDADGTLWVRAAAEDVERGWPWGDVPEAGTNAAGGVAEGGPVRPLTLLVRGGRAVGGVVIAE